jgi:hypothetical protein
VSYGPWLELGSKASKEAVRKRRNDAGAEPTGKHAKVSGRKAMAPKGTSAASSKDAFSKVAPLKAAPSHTKPMLKAGAAPKASVPLKAGAPVKATVQKSMTMPAMKKAGVHRIGTGLKTQSAELSQVPKGKQAKVDVMSSLASAPIRKAIVWP